MSKKRLIRIIAFFVVVIAVGLFTMSYMFRGAEKTVENIDAQFTVSSDELYNLFSSDEASANAKYLNKVVEVSGLVSEVETLASGQLVVLMATESPMGGVRCTFEANQEKIAKKVSVGAKHTIKRKCSGMLMEVVLDNCSLTN